jgi:hypothetical protein
VRAITHAIQVAFGSLLAIAASGHGLTREFARLTRRSVTAT